MALRGDMSESKLEALRAALAECVELIKKEHSEHGKVRGLLDLSGCKSYHPEVLVLVGEFVTTIKPYFERAAVYGAKGTIDFARGVVLALARWEEVQSFAKEKDALAWVLGEDE
jgi:hypothetical protein